jgi:hypothetical protein
MGPGRPAIPYKVKAPPTTLRALFAPADIQTPHPNAITRIPYRRKDEATTDLDGASRANNSLTD